MDGLVNDMNALVAPDLTTDAPDWCENCQALRKEIRRLQEEQGQNFGKLKQKIISTDLLIKKYKAKCEDYDLLCKKTEEVNKKADKQMRQSSILETQLRAALLDVDPLRQRKTALEAEVKDQALDIQKLTDKVMALEGTQKQYEYLSKASSADVDKLDLEKKELLNKIKTLESGKVSKEAAKEFKVEISTLKKENHLLTKNQQRLDRKLTTAQAKIETLTQALKDAKSSPVRRRRTASGSARSPLKSPLRRAVMGRGISPKPSPSHPRRTRTLSGREIPPTTKVADMVQSDINSDDEGSVSSLSWTFSPLTKCLSPLPPSPACFSKTTQNIESDGGSLSDMADELEQQLAEDFDHIDDDPVEDLKQTSLPYADEKYGENKENEERDNDATLIEEPIEEGDLFDLSKYELGDKEGKTEVEELKQDNHILIHTVNVETCDTSTSVQEKSSEAHSIKNANMEIQDEVECNAEEVTSKKVLDAKQSSVNIKDECISGHVVFEKRGTQDKVAEIADKENNTLDTDNGTNVVKSEQKQATATSEQTSIENFITRVQKKRVAYGPVCHNQKPNTNNCHEMFGKGDIEVKNAKSSACLQNTEESQNIKKDSGHDTAISANNKQFPRTDTKEFLPVLQESTEALSDSEPDTETRGFGVQTAPDFRGDASSMKLVGKPTNQVSKVDIDMEIEDQTELVERQFLPNRGLLLRQRHLSSEGNQSKNITALPEQDKKVKNISPNSKNTCKFSQKNKKNTRGKSRYGKHNFIAFQKSSSGTLSEEIDNLASDVDYVCNDRSELEGNKMNEGLDTKDVDVSKFKVKTKRTYKDLDSVFEDSNPEFDMKTRDNKNKTKENNKHTLEEDSEVVTQDKSESDLLENESFISNSVMHVSVMEDDKVIKENSSEDKALQPIDKNVLSGELTSQTHSHGEGNAAEMLKYNGNECVLERKQEVNQPECDEDDTETQEELSEITSKSDAINSASETEEAQTSRRLSTGFVVNLPYSDHHTDSSSPSALMDKDKIEKKKSRLTSNCLSDTVLENIQEEDSQMGSLKFESNDTTQGHSISNAHEINQPSCSYHYNAPVETVHNVLSSSVSLSGEIAKIMDTPEPSGSRVISCTPDMLDSEIETFSQLDSRTGSPDSDSLESREPLSPLPISPFDFIIPISPLPPSPFREIIRVSPLSPTLSAKDEGIAELDLQASTDDIEVENQVDEHTVKTVEGAVVVEEQREQVTVVNKLIKTKSHLFSVDDLNFGSVPAILSPIRTPEHRKTCDRLKKSQNSAFIKVSKGTVKDAEKRQREVNNRLKTSKVNKKSSSIRSILQDSRTHEGIDKINKSDNKSCEESKAHLYLFSKSSVAGNDIKQESDKNKTSTDIKPEEKQSDQVVIRASLQNTVKEDATIPELPIPDGHDNLVATKKKCRMAHRPNIQTMKPQKVQLIEAQSLPVPTVGRKRKSLEAADKDGQEKKQYKAPTFLKPKESTVSKEETKRMQIFLKSVDTPDNFVTKAAATDQGDCLGPRLVESCLECLGRNRTDTTDVVYKICESGDFRSCQLQWPFLSDIEKQAMKLLKYLYSHDQLKTPYRSVMCQLWDRVFSNSVSLSVVGQMCYCKVYTALCCLEGDVEQPRVLLYHMVTSSHPNYVLNLVPVVSVWPEVLMKPHPDRPDKITNHGLLVVLEEVITRVLLSQDLEVNKKILLVLQKLCGWRGSCGDTETILKNMLTKMADVAAETPVNHDAVYGLTQAIQLLSVGGGWPWFKEFFIMRNGLQTVANRFQAKVLTKPVPPAYLCAILKITGLVTNSLSATVPVKDIEQFTRIWVFPILAHAEGDPEVSRACDEVLLELSPLLPNLLKGVNSRLASLPAAIREEFTGRLEVLRRQYQTNMLL